MGPAAGAAALALAASPLAAGRAWASVAANERFEPSSEVAAAGALEVAVVVDDGAGWAAGVISEALPVSMPDMVQGPCQPGSRGSLSGRSRAQVDALQRPVVGLPLQPAVLDPPLAGRDLVDGPADRGGLDAPLSPGVGGTLERGKRIGDRALLLRNQPLRRPRKA